MAQLKQTGAWLRLCGEGIYATRPRPGDQWQEGNAIRFTRSKDERTVYCYALQWPGRTLHIQSARPKEGSEIRMFGCGEPMKWTFDSAKGLTVDLPESLQEHRPNEYAWGWTIQVT